MRTRSAARACAALDWPGRAWTSSGEPPAAPPCLACSVLRGRPPSRKHLSTTMTSADFCIVTPDVAAARAVSSMVFAAIHRMRRAVRRSAGTLLSRCLIRKNAQPDVARRVSDAGNIATFATFATFAPLRPLRPSNFCYLMDDAQRWSEEKFLGRKARKGEKNAKEFPFGDSVADAASERLNHLSDQVPVWSHAGLVPSCTPASFGQALAVLPLPFGRRLSPMHLILQRTGLRPAAKVKRWTRTN